MRWRTILSSVAQQHQQTQQHAPEHQPEQKAQPQAGPGLAAVEAVRGSGEPAAQATAQILQAHPDEREQILTWLHQHHMDIRAAQHMDLHAGAPSHGIDPDG